MFGIQSRFNRALSLAGVVTVMAVLVLSGCGSDSTEETGDNPTAGARTSEARSMAGRFLRYSYEGAILSSTHPLNDSISALVRHPAPGKYVTLVDTFVVESAEVTSDTTAMVSATFPHAIKVSSDWRTKEPQVDAQRTLRLGPDRILEGPRIVGWKALEAHILEVVSDSGDAVVKRIQNRFRRVTEEPAT